MLQVVLTEKKIVVDEKTENVQALIAVIQEKTAIASTQQEQASVKQKLAEVCVCVCVCVMRMCVCVRG